MVRGAPRVRARRRVRLLGDRVRGRPAPDLGRRREDDAGAVRGQRGSPDGSAADRRCVQRRRGHLHVVRPLAALRDRQPARRAARARPISSTSTCVGRSISSTRGATSTSSTATTTTGSGPSWSRPTPSRSSATGHASSSRRMSAPRRPRQTEVRQTQRAQHGLRPESRSSTSVDRQPGADLRLVVDVLLAG